METEGFLNYFVGGFPLDQQLLTDITFEYFSPRFLENEFSDRKSELFGWYDFDTLMNISIQEEKWRERNERQSELSGLDELVVAGDLKASIRYCQLSEESQVEALYKYRDMYFKIMLQQGKEVDYREFQCIDIWYKNLKATYSFLEERKRIQEPIQ